MSFNHLSLFSGVGMTDLAVEAFGGTTVATAEIEPFARSVLQARYPNAVHFARVEVIHEGSFEAMGIDPSSLAIDLVSGGFPCQDIALPGTGKGLDGNRSGLWREFARVLRLVKPRYALIENVSALKGRGLGAILNDLYWLGYDAEWDCLPAAAFGAPHLRDRMWIMAERRSPRGFRTDAALKLRKARTIGWVGEPRNGVVNPQGQIEKLPRSGFLIEASVREAEPRATVSQCNKASKSNGRAVLRNKTRALRLRPTPTRADGTGGPGTSPKRKGGMNLRTYIAQYFQPGPLNPEFLEWMMGLPIGWTNPYTLAQHAFYDWERYVPPPVKPKVRDWRKRLIALGNGLVPHVAYYCLQIMMPQYQKGESWLR